jgi:hypothetical protein
MQRSEMLTNTRRHGNEDVYNNTSIGTPTTVCDSTSVGRLFTPYLKRDGTSERNLGTEPQKKPRYILQLSCLHAEHTAITKKVSAIRDAFLLPEEAVLTNCVVRQVAR